MNHPPVAARRIRAHAVVACLAAACAVVPASRTVISPSPTATMDAVLRRASAHASGDASLLRVIVGLDGGGRSGLEALLAAHGHHVVAELPLVDAVTVDAHASDLAALAAVPGVRSLSSDGRVAAAHDTLEFNRVEQHQDVDGSRRLTLNTAASQPPMAVVTDAAGASVALRASLGIAGTSTSGNGIGVAVIDSGVQKNADIEDLTGWKDFTPAAKGTPYDDFGHGTHIAGLIKGKGDLSDAKYQGVGFSTNIIGLKVLDANGQGDVTTVIAAIQYAVAKKSSLGIDIINLSLGHPV